MRRIKIVLKCDKLFARQLAKKLVRDLRQTSRVATNESLPTGENTLEKTGQGLNLQQTSRGTTNESLPPGKLVTNRVATNASRQPTQVEHVRWGGGKRPRFGENENESALQGNQEKEIKFTSTSQTFGESLRVKGLGIGDPTQKFRTH